MLAALEARLRYTFTTPALLTAALTHPTFVNEHPDAGPHYERLEFLGDAVVGLIVADALYLAFPKAREGELTRMRSHAVCREQLAARARVLSLAGHLRLGESLRDKQKEPGDTVLSDAFEALVGAVMVDGGLTAARRVFGPLLVRANDDAANAVRRDAKTELQEEAHRCGWAPPHYRLVRTEGPAHDRRYVVHITAGTFADIEGVATSKKGAEQVCAGRVLEQIEAASVKK